MSFLKLAYLPEDDWHGELQVSVEAFGFNGRSSSWITCDRLLDFAQKLAAFPMSTEELASLSDGLAGSDSRGHEALLRLLVAPASATGLLRVEVKLVGQSHLANMDLRQQCHVSFLVDRAAIDRFRIALAAMVPEGGEVDLHGLEC